VTASTTSHAAQSPERPCERNEHPGHRSPVVGSSTRRGDEVSESRIGALVACHTIAALAMTHDEQRPEGVSPMRSPQLGQPAMEPRFMLPTALPIPIDSNPCIVEKLGRDPLGVFRNSSVPVETENPPALVNPPRSIGVEPYPLSADNAGFSSAHALTACLQIVRR